MRKFLLVTAAFLPLVTGAFAETGNAAQIETVVVTAQKRLQDLQIVPISAQVFSADQIVQRNVTSLRDLSETTPGLHVSTDPDGAGEAQIFLRGVGSGPSETFDQSVAIFVDDVYKGRGPLAEVAFLDLDRVEVLKGPQSTFFGNNAVAGAISIVTADPGEQWGGWARGGFGSFNQYVVEGAADAPLADDFRVRVAANISGNSGWIENVTTGKSPATDNYSGRITAVYEPIDGLEFNLKVSGSSYAVLGSGQEYPLQIFRCPMPAPLGPPQDKHICVNALATGSPIGLNLDKAAWLAPGGYWRLSDFNTTLKTTYQLSDFTLTATTAYDAYHNKAAQSDPTPVFFRSGWDAEHYDQFSQEIRLASPTTGRFDYMVGAYFQSDRLVSTTGTVNPNLAFAAISPAFLTVAAIVGGTQSENIYSVFASGDFHVTDQLTLTAGIRGEGVSKIGSLLGLQLGRSDQKFGGFQFISPADNQTELAALGLNGALAEPKFSKWYHAWMPSAGVQYQFDPAVMAYFKYANGFKAGGVNMDNDFNVVANDYAPEHVDSYELGLKSKWADDTVLFNIDIFREDYSDLQVQANQFNAVLNGFFLFVENAAQSVSQGVEIEGQWAVTPQLHLAAYSTFLDSHYASFPNAQPTFVQGALGLLQQDLSGKPTDFAPKASGSLIASYDLPVGDGFHLVTTLSSYLTTSYFASAATDDPLRKIPGYMRLDGQVTLVSPDGHWSVDLIGKNLTDRTIPTGIVFPDVATKEQPINVFGQVRYQW
jgi:outer membrane receptor protein involved in Fe transport